MAAPGHVLSASTLSLLGASLSPEATARAERALEMRRAASRAGELTGHWLFDSPALTGIVETARRLARAQGAPILIEGERGTGVQELARLIHDTDLTSRGRFRAMAAELVSVSDLSGRALEGTLFIEDLENLRPSGQEWLRGLLESRTHVAASFRIVAGSRHSVGDLLARRGFSQELLHALDVGRLVIPPLRRRPQDILPLARRFLQHYAEWQGRPELRFSAAAERKLMAQTYPANVRELRNIVERAAALATEVEIGDDAIVVFESPDAAKLPAEPVRGALAAVRQGVEHLPTMVELERDYLVMLIRELKGRRVAISRAMGLSYPTVLKKIARHRLDVRAIVDAAGISGDALE